MIDGVSYAIEKDTLPLSTVQRCASKGVLQCNPSGISSSLYCKIILDNIIVRFGCGLFIEASVSIYSSKCLHQETAASNYHYLMRKMYYLLEHVSQTTIHSCY